MRKHFSGSAFARECPYSSGIHRRAAVFFAFCAVAFTLLYLRVGYLSRSPGLTQTARREAQAKIVTLKAQYKTVSEVSGLKQWAERMVVEGYRTEKNLDLYSKVRYNKDGTVVVTDDWKSKGKVTIPKRYMPNAIVETQTVYKNGTVQIDRTLYDSNAVMYKQIHSGPHNRLDQHHFGEFGEHAHNYTWTEGKENPNVERRDLTDAERVEHSDILKGGGSNEK